MQKILILILTLFSFNVNAQNEIRLYDAIPNNKSSDNLEKSDIDANGILRISKVSVPTLTIYQPTATQNPNGTAIIICPGGGYAILAASHEGSDVAKELNEWGITAFVLKYRIPDDKTQFDKSISPLQDAERAIQLVRQNAKKWGINPKKVGIMGFSAGGHLAASLSTRYNEMFILNAKKNSLRPDFSVLVYPVISFTDSLAHKGSRTNLLGSRPSQKKIEQYSNELNINKKTPPAFLVHAKDDKTVRYENSLVYFEALQKNNVPAELKLFEKGGHGFGMNNKTTDEKWMDSLKLWLIKMNFLKQ